MIRSTQMSTGNTYTIVVPDGNPDSTKIIQKGNWIGELVQFSRESYKHNRNTSPYKEILERPGVYILIGPDDAGIKVYIGEGDGIKGRIENHYINRDFWDTAIVITAGNDSFDKVQIQYIESKLVQTAYSANTCKMENGNSPNLPSTSHAARINAENTIHHILDCVRMLGYTIFTTAQASPPPHQSPTNPTQMITSGTSLDQLFIFEAKVRDSQVHATGSYQNGKLIVSKGSVCTHDISDKCPAAIASLKKQLEEQHIIQRAGNNQPFVFTQDYAFKSPSAASGVISGRSSNGLTDWKTAQGITLSACLTQ